MLFAYAKGDIICTNHVSYLSMESYFTAFLYAALVPRQKRGQNLAPLLYVSQYQIVQGKWGFCKGIFGKNENLRNSSAMRQFVRKYVPQAGLRKHF